MAKVTGTVALLIDTTGEERLKSCDDDLVDSRKPGFEFCSVGNPSKSERCSHEKGVVVVLWNGGLVPQSILFYLRNECGELFHAFKADY